MILNRASAAVASSGVTSNYPVVIAGVDGQRYLVSMLGDNVQWVHTTYVHPVEERFSGAAPVRRSNSKRCPPTSAHPS